MAINFQAGNNEKTQWLSIGWPWDEVVWLLGRNAHAALGIDLDSCSRLGESGKASTNAAWSDHQDARPRLVPAHR
jgi:hypothetical protein